MWYVLDSLNFGGAIKCRLKVYDYRFTAVLLTPQKEAKICDFGAARKLECEAQATSIGTPIARAPEVHNDMKCYIADCM